MSPRIPRSGAPNLEEGKTLDRVLARGNDVVDGEVRLGSDEVERRSAALAGALRSRGVGRGDVVAWQLPNWHEAVVCFRACWRIGAVAAPLHHRAGEQELAGQLTLLQPRLLLAAPSLPAASRRCVLEVRGNGDFETLLDSSPVAPREAATGDRAVVLFTSGSSDAPKGVIHTHGSLAHKAAAMAAVHDLGPADAVLMPAPLAHVSGLLNGVLLPAAAGMKAVLMERWDPAAALGLIATERVSFMVGPPTFFLGLLEAPGFSPEQVASLRLISCGGTGVTPEFVRRASSALGATVKRSYGSTEAPTVTTSHAGDPLERASTTDGRAVGDVELRMVDPASGDPLPPGTLGEVWIRGREVFAGYLGGDPAGTFAEGGWFRSGDLGRLDDEGWLTIEGRVRDVIIRGGENISPAEVESILEAHPAVRRAVAVGLPSERLGEVVAALVVADDPLDLDGCRAWFAERGVARFKTPEVLLRVPELPLLASGKPDRRAALELLARP